MNPNESSSVNPLFSTATLPPPPSPPSFPLVQSSYGEPRRDSEQSTRHFLALSPQDSHQHASVSSHFLQTNGETPFTVSDAPLSSLEFSAPMPALPHPVPSSEIPSSAAFIPFDMPPPAFPSLVDPPPPHLRSVEMKIQAVVWRRLMMRLLCMAPLQPIIAAWMHRPILCRGSLSFFRKNLFSVERLLLFLEDVRLSSDPSGFFAKRLQENFEKHRRGFVKDDSDREYKLDSTLEDVDFVSDGVELITLIALFDRSDFLEWLASHEVPAAFTVPAAISDQDETMADPLTECMLLGARKCVEVCVRFPGALYWEQDDDLMFHIEAAHLCGQPEFVPLLANCPKWKELFNHHYEHGREVHKHVVSKSLMFAAEEGLWAFLQSVFQNLGDVIDINHRFAETSSFSGIPMLVYAVTENHLRTTQVLCDLGADPDIKYGPKPWYLCGKVQGQTPWEIASTRQIFDIVWNARSACQRRIYMATIVSKWVIGVGKLLLRFTPVGGLAEAAASSLGVAFSASRVPKSKSSEFKLCEWCGLDDLDPSDQREHGEKWKPVYLFPSAQASYCQDWSALQSYFPWCPLSDASVHALIAKEFYVLDDDPSFGWIWDGTFEK